MDTPPSVEPNPSTTTHAEPLRETVQIPRRALVAVQDPQRVVGVVVSLRRGQDVGQRLADVVGVGGAVASHIRQ